MPGFTTHFLFGFDAYKKMPSSPLKHAIYRHQGAYNLGQQGPDIFFYFLPSHLLHRENIGSVAHTKNTGVFLRSLLESQGLFISKDESEIAEAYIAGFLAHYTLDCKCHPYVYFRTHYKEPSASYSGKHFALETDMDNELLAFHFQTLPSEFSQSDTIHLTRAQVRVIAKILHHAYSNAYPEIDKVSDEIMSLAIRSMQLGTRMLRDPAGKKKVIVRKVEALSLGYPVLSPMIASDKILFFTDPLNLARQKWRSPFDPSAVSNDSFVDLMEQAQEEYLKRLALFQEKKQDELLEDLGNRSYHSGLPL